MKEAGGVGGVKLEEYIFKYDIDAVMRKKIYQVHKKMAASRWLMRVESGYCFLLLLH